MAEKMGVSVIGAGWVAGEHIKAYRANPDTELRAICDVDLDAAKNRAAELGCGDVALTADFREAVGRDDVQIVSVCTPNHLHYEQGMAALEAGKHVFIEKPLATCWAHCTQLRDAAARRGLITGVGFVARWYTAVAGMKKMRDAGAIGDVTYVEADYFHEIAPGWKSTAETAGRSPLTMAGCHAVDMVRWIKGLDVPVASVYALSTPAGWRKDFTYEPNMALLLRFADGTAGKVASSLESNMPYVFNIFAQGTGGALRNGTVYSQGLQVAKAFMRIPGVYADDPDVQHHPFDEMLGCFVDCIGEGAEPQISFADACKTFEIVFAAEQSAATGQAVPLPLAQ
jgi:predicted dehydrogenase